MNPTDQDMEAYQHHAEKHRVLEQVRAAERERIALQLSPMTTFIRGVQVGALVIGGINTIFPGQFGVADWPLWMRLLTGGLCILVAVHFLLEQRGYMIAKRISKA
jgi:hypothetical protein